MTRLQDLAASGQSIWIDYIRRSFTRNGDLQRLIDDGVAGVTSNPAIFEKAIGASSDYDDDLAALVQSGASIDTIYEDLALKDIAEAADLFLPIFERTHGYDGFVSIEVSPSLAHDTEGTIAEAQRLWNTLKRPNIMIKVPATPAGVPAIEELIADGINVNVTLIFSTAQYEPVAMAYITGLERRAAGGARVDRVASVASFFVSRVDSAVDKELAAKGRADLQGKAAIANAMVAYDRFRALFSGPRWEKLAGAGARVQRPLWASTGTKNPAYSDVLYVDTLVARDTVNTLPPATLDAYQDHGATAPSLVDGIEGAKATITELSSLGIDVDVAVASTLQVDGVKLFADAFDALSASIATKRMRLLAGFTADDIHAGVSSAAVSAAIKDLDANDVVQRVWNIDHTVFGPSPEEIANRLGWLRVMNEVLADAGQIEAFAEAVRQAGYTKALLLGMGGSSLAPEVFRRTFGVKPGYLDLEIVDTTSPDAIAALAARINPATTLFIVSTKSGGTVETFSFLKYFYNFVSESLPNDRAGDHFIAITDAGSGLATLADDLHFRATFTANPDIGGRYSALSHFGMVPAALMGVDIRELLGRASRLSAATDEPSPTQTSSPAVLGAALAEFAKAGRDKLTFLLAPSISSWGDWVEQLVAESTGKNGLGILPVIGPSHVEPAGYGNDRVFVSISLAGGEPAADTAALEAAGHPVISITVADDYDLGALCFAWEFATAIACHRLGINPFDQPNVESAKIVAREMMARFEADGVLPQVPPSVVEDGLSIAADPAVAGLGDALATLAAPSPAYVAIQAYLPPTDQTTAALAAIRAALERNGAAVTVGYGPRFLHSTGQLHKGDGGNGRFLQLTATPATDLPIPVEAGKPESNITFGTLIAAQALGDRQALLDAGRTVIRIDLGSDIFGGLTAIRAALE